MKTHWRQLFKTHQIKTQASRVDRGLFPQFINRLYQKAAKPKYLHSAFRRSGIYPLSEYAVPQWKITPSLPVSEDSPVTARNQNNKIEAAASQLSQTSQQQQSTKLLQGSKVTYTTTIKMSVRITQKGEKLTVQDLQSTPNVKSYFKEYFIRLLKKSSPKKPTQKSARIPLYQ
jgi:hypothetical protein